jgi:serralysin
MAGADEYTVWSTDNNGNYISNLIGAVSGTSAALESFETIFNQDLNSDGVVGLNPHVIQTDTSTLGSTSLATIGNNYFLYAAGGTTGPELHYRALPVTSGEFGGWAPIGAVETASGYDIAWKDASSGAYTVWTTDSNGNYLANAIGAVAGNSYALESFETIFNQDLNGDGVVGLYAAPGSTSHFNQPLSGASGAATIGAGATLETHDRRFRIRHLCHLYRHVEARSAVDVQRRDFRLHWRRLALQLRSNRSKGN